MRRSLGQFQPINALGGRRDRPAEKRPIITGAAPLLQPPAKRRRTDEVPSSSSPIPIPIPALPASTRLPPVNGSRKRLSDASSDTTGAGSPDRAVCHGSATSLMTGDSQQSQQSPNGTQSPEAHRRGRRRRRIIHASARPERLTSPSLIDIDEPNGRADAEVIDDSDENNGDGDADGDGDGDDQSSVQEVPRPKSNNTTRPSNQYNTELSIVLQAGVPKRQPFRARMQADNQGTRQPQGPGQGQGGSVKRSFHGPIQLSDSADELSEDHYAGRWSKRARGPAASLSSSSASSSSSSASSSSSSSGPAPVSVRNITESPVHVAAAFRHPSHLVEAEQTMTIDLRDPDTLTLADAAQRTRLPWLRIALDKARAIQYNTDAPFLCMEFPQTQGYHAAMGIRFASTADSRRVVAWILQSPLLRNIRLEDKSSFVLQKVFERGLASARDRKEVLETRAKVDATQDDSFAVVIEAAAANANANANAGWTEQSSPAGRPEPASAASTPRVVKDGLGQANIRRARASLNLRSAASENVRPRERTGSATPKTSEAGTAAAATAGAAGEAAADTRLGRLRNRSSRASLRYMLDEPEAERWTETNPGWAANWRIPLTYARTTVDKDDVARLDEGEFLNDNIINFYLQFLQGTLRKSASSLADRVYFHNTFFYEKLRPSRGSAIAFDGVKRWTAKVDLFSYDYIVVPVNENAHWWVAIICNVPKILAAALPEADPEGPEGLEGEGPEGPEGAKEREKEKEEKKETIDVDAADTDADVAFVSATPRTPRTPAVISSIEVDDAVAVAKPATPATKDQPCEVNDGSGDELSSDEEGSDDDDEVTEIKPDAVVSSSAAPSPAAAAANKKVLPTTAKNSRNVFIPGSKKQDPTDPRIFTLDSLGSVHTASVHHLKQWLLAEIAERKGVRPRDPGRLGTTAKAIPEQENFCDCGLFLLLYIQEFIKDPDGFVEDLVLRRPRTWDTSAPAMRTQLRDLILHMQREYQEAEEAAKRQKKKRRGVGVVKGSTDGVAMPDQEAVVVDDGVTLPPIKAVAKETNPANPANPETTEICDTSSSVVRSSSPPPAVVASDGPANGAAAKPSSVPGSWLETEAAKTSESEASPISPADAGCSSPFKTESAPVFARPI